MSPDLKQRLFGVLYLAPLVICVFLGQPFLGIIIGILQALMCYEMACLFGRDKTQIILYAVLFVATVLSVTFVIFMPLALSVVLMMISVLLVSWRFGILSALFCGLVLLCLGSLSLLILLPNAASLLGGLALIIAAGDVGAYFVGRKVGGKKLAPAISPNKTISGALGGLGLSVVAAFLVAPYVAIISEMPILVGVIIGVFAQAGDLFESAFKRKIGVKDSSNLIPGHGGFLDRFDGYLFVLPLVLLLAI